MGMVNSMNSANIIPTQNVRKRRMKGPNIDLDDIPDANDIP